VVVHSRVRGWGNFCTTQQLLYPFADVAVPSSENTSDKKSIVHTLSFKEFFRVRVRKRGHSRKKETIEYV